MTEPDYYELHRRYMALLHRGVHDATLAEQLQAMEVQRRAERARSVQARHEQEMAPVLEELMTLREPISRREPLTRPTDADIAEMRAAWDECGRDLARIRDIANEMGLPVLTVRRHLLGHSNARKLTADQVRKMRAAYDASDKSRGTISAIARRFDANHSLVSDIVHRKKWKDAK